MKSLFQNIRTGVITKPAIESQLEKFRHEKLQLTRNHLARKIGADLYTKKLAEMNFCIEMLLSIVNKYDDLRLPLKVKPNIVGTNPDGEAFDPVCGLAVSPSDNEDAVSGIENETNNGRDLSDEGPNFSTDG